MKVSGKLTIAVVLIFISIFYFAMRKTFKSAEHSRSLIFSYSVRVNNIPSGTQKADVLIPVPQSDNHQIVSNLLVESPYPHTFIIDSEYGNKLLTVEAVGNLEESFEVKMLFSVNRKRYSSLDGSMKDVDTPSESLKARFLAPDKLVPLSGPVEEETEKVIAGDLSVLAQARAIYNDVVSTMTYDKSGDGWGRGDVIHACTARSGNCTDFHSLFIGMARSAGIPARFIMGFPIPETADEGEIGGYHCWAEFYTEELGWVPVDASEASKNPDKTEFYFGTLDENRVAFTMGRDISFNDELLPEPLNYLIYPLVFIDGTPYDDFEKKFLYAPPTSSRSY